MYTKIIKKVSWTNYQDYILADGEAGYDLTTKELKIGNGINTWAELSIAQSANINEIYNAESELKNSVNPQTDGLTRVSYGQKIWEVEAGQQLTLKTDGLKLQSNIIVKTPANSFVPCDKDHVVEVEELPTVDIDVNTLYFYQNKYYKIGKQLDNVYVFGMPFVDALSELGYSGSTVDYYYSDTTPTSDIKETYLSEPFHFNVYYIRERDGLFLYAEPIQGFKMWISPDQINEALAYGGVITDSSQAPEKTYDLYALIPWEIYFKPSGELTIIENGKHNVSIYESVNVAVPAPPDNPVPLAVDSEAEMNRLLTDTSVATGAVYKYVGKTGTYKNGVLYELREEI